MSCAAPFRWSSAALSDVGLVRSRNEDACLALPARGLWAVADGMGGHAYGDVASQMVVEAIARLPAPVSLTQYVADAHRCLQQVNQQLRAEAVARKVPVMGSTVVLLLACGRELACLWAGDSRLYMVRKGRLHQVTRDHSQPAGVVSNMITRAVGAADVLDVDEVLIDGRTDDMFLLCSDGLSNPVDEQAIVATLATADCAQAAQSLIAQALANGGRDNITAVVLRADDGAGGPADNRADDKTMLNPLL